MKILESQSAVLTNYEVYSFLKSKTAEAEERKKDKTNHHRDPANLETVRREVILYLESAPNPLSQKPLTYNDEVIPKLLQRLRPYDITKGEMIMMLNLRPTTQPALNTVLEDMMERFDDEQKQDILNGVVEVLGAFPDPEEAAQGDQMDTAETGGG